MDCFFGLGAGAGCNDLQNLATIRIVAPSATTSDESSGFIVGICGQDLPMTGNMNVRTREMCTIEWIMIGLS